MALHLSSKSFSQNRQYIPTSILLTEKRRPRNYMICLIAQPGLNEVQRHLRWCSSYLTRQNFQIPMGPSKSNLSFHFFSIEFSQCINGSHIHITTNTKKTLSNGLMISFLKMSILIISILILLQKTKQTTMSLKLLPDHDTLVFLNFIYMFS